jgi:hypothetical protein
MPWLIKKDSRNLSGPGMVNQNPKRIQLCGVILNGLDFGQGSDAAGAESLLHLSTIFVDSNLLEIGPKLTFGGLFRPGSVLPKFCGFATRFTFSHCWYPHS